MIKLLSLSQQLTHWKKTSRMQSKRIWTTNHKWTKRDAPHCARWRQSDVFIRQSTEGIVLERQATSFFWCLLKVKCWHLYGLRVRAIYSPNLVVDDFSTSNLDSLFTSFFYCFYELCGPMFPEGGGHGFYRPPVDFSVALFIALSVSSYHLWLRQWNEVIRKWSGTVCHLKLDQFIPVMYEGMQRGQRASPGWRGILN